MDDSILNGTKKALGVDPSYDVFDHEIIMHINSTFSTLHQLGVGPKVPFVIQDSTDRWGPVYPACRPTSRGSTHTSQSGWTPDAVPALYARV